MPTNHLLTTISSILPPTNTTTNYSFTLYIIIHPSNLSPISQPLNHTHTFINSAIFSSNNHPVTTSSHLPPFSHPSANQSFTHYTSIHPSTLSSHQPTSDHSFTSSYLHHLIHKPITRSLHHHPLFHQLIHQLTMHTFTTSSPLLPTSQPSTTHPHSHPHSSFHPLIHLLSHSHLHSSLSFHPFIHHTMTHLFTTFPFILPSSRPSANHWPQLHYSSIPPVSHSSANPSPAHIFIHPSIFSSFSQPLAHPFIHILIHLSIISSISQNWPLLTSSPTPLPSHPLANQSPTHYIFIHLSTFSIIHIFTQPSNLTPFQPLANHRLLSTFSSTHPFFHPHPPANQSPTHYTLIHPSMSYP